MEDKNLGKVYEQYWLQARHNETQRLWFTQIYAVIVAGAFVYLIKGSAGLATMNELSILYLSILIFLLTYSVLGYIVTHSWNIAFVAISRLAEEIAIFEWNLPKEYRRYTKYGKAYQYYKNIGFGPISVRISAARAFIGFYSLMIGIFVVLIYRAFSNVSNVSDLLPIILVGAITFVIPLLYYTLYLEKMSIGKIIKDYQERVEEYQEEKEENMDTEDKIIIRALAKEFSKEEEERRAIKRKVDNILLAGLVFLSIGVCFPVRFLILQKWDCYWLLFSGCIALLLGISLIFGSYSLKKYKKEIEGRIEETKKEMIEMKDKYKK